MNVLLESIDLIYATMLALCGHNILAYCVDCYAGILDMSLHVLNTLNGKRFAGLKCCGL